jgi:hypothetical protein
MNLAQGLHKTAAIELIAEDLFTLVVAISAHDKPARETGRALFVPSRRQG